MPFLHLQVATAPGVHVSDDELARVLTTLAHQALGKRAEVTAVRIERVAPESWFIGGLPLAPRLQSAIQLQIQVTAGTNTAAEKSAFVERAFQELSRLLGGLHTTSYVVVQELPANAWGYGGVTQAARQAAREQATAAAL
jgi:4-oxalocrotonate tautomerase